MMKNRSFKFKFFLNIIKRYYVASLRQFRRLNLVSKSPIFAFFDETLMGGATIRAYKKQDLFYKEMCKRIDENLNYYYPEIISMR